jgi:two-component system, NtrC family, sensor kinase
MSTVFNTNSEDAFTDPKGLTVQTLEGIDDPVSVKNDQMKFLFVNEAFCVFYNKKREEFLGKELPEITHDLYTGSEWKQDKEILETGKEHSDNCVSIDDDGNSRILTAKKIRLTDKTGRHYIFCILKEISKAIPEPSQKLPFLTKSGTPVSREIIHDLNNSLNIVRGYSELLLEDISANDPMRKDLEAIYESGRKAAEIASKF